MEETEEGEEETEEMEEPPSKKARSIKPVVAAAPPVNFSPCSDVVVSIELLNSFSSLFSLGSPSSASEASGEEDDDSEEERTSQRSGVAPIRFGGEEDSNSQ